MQITLYLEELLTNWENEVLSPLGFLTCQLSSLPPNHAYWKQRKDLIEHHQERLCKLLLSSTLSEQEKVENVFTALADTLNIYGREVLKKLHLIDKEKALGNLEHSYWSMKLAFVMKAIDDIKLYQVEC